MLLEVSNVTDFYLSCFQQPLATTISYFNRDYLLMYTTAWNFSETFLHAFNGIESNVEMYSTLGAIEKYIGIKSYINIITDYELVIEGIKKELENGNPVVAYMNPYWCTWSSSYQLGRATHHYVLIIGYEETHFWCYDMRSTGPEKLTYEAFKMGSKEYITFRLEKQPTFDINQLKINICHEMNLFNNDNYNMFKNMISFAERMKNKFNITEEIDGYIPYKFAPIFTWIKEICVSRRKMVFLYEYISNFEKNLDNKLWCEQFEDLYKEWYSIRLALFKSISSTKSSRIYENIYNRIISIEAKERLLFDDIFNWLIISDNS
ncbi:MAG: C39 family peptidase [Clostridium argentinense]|nr:C39 family peptidase [Clostridium argentinense]